MRVCTATHVVNTVCLHRCTTRLSAPTLNLSRSRAAFAGCRSSLLTRPGLTKARTTQQRRTTMGLPVPIIGPLFNPFVAAIAYALGAARFWSNYSRTSFENSQATKTRLTALWPILFVSSQSFRADFKKTLSD